MTTRQREKRLQHPQAWLDHAWNEWCLRADRAIDWQYCADRIGLPLNQTLNLGRVLGLVDAKTADSDDFAPLHRDDVAPDSDMMSPRGPVPR
jgi:hypothetical protein